MKTNATTQELNAALEAVNRKFEGNITIAVNAISRNRNSFTLGVISSRGAGSRIGFTGRRVSAACWHVHGYFFDELIKINPAIWVKSSMATVDVNGGNWQDRNIGSAYSPLYYSDACDCGGVK